MDAFWLLIEIVTDIFNWGERRRQKKAAEDEGKTSAPLPADLRDDLLSLR